MNITKSLAKIIFVALVYVSKAVCSQQHCSSDCSVAVRNRNSNVVRRVSCTVQVVTHEPTRLGFTPNASAQTSELGNLNKMWKIYRDSTSGKNKIGLQIKWKPQMMDLPLQQLKGFGLHVHEITKNQSIFLFFNISDGFLEDDAIQDYFSYNCVGTTDDFHISPRDKIQVEIICYPLSQNKRRLLRLFTIPSCQDDRMKNVLECEAKRPSIEIEKGCTDRTKTVKYNLLPTRKGDTGNFLLCLHFSDPEFCTFEVLFNDNLALNGTLDLHLPKTFSKNQTYSVQIWVDGNRIRYSKRISFTDCDENVQDAKPKSKKTLEIIAGLIAFSIVLLILVYLVVSSFERMKRVENDSTEH